MIAFSWRQFRPQALVGAAGLLLVAVVLVITGPHLVRVYDAALATCPNPNGGPGPSCKNGVSGTFAGIQVALNAVVLVVPALVGMFWGAPLVARELESGTFRLAWTQSVSRLRWLVVKMGLVGLASVVVAGGLSLMSSWWFSPIDKVNQNRFSPSSFALHGFVPAGYAVFAFTLGAAVGLLLRRTLPAMVVTLFGFIAVRLGVTYWVRPHFMTPVTASLPLAQGDWGFEAAGPGSPLSVVASAPDLPNAMVSGVRIAGPQGQAPDASVLKSICPNLGQATPAPSRSTSSGGLLGGHSSVQSVGQRVQDTMSQCISRLTAAKYHVVVSYQPANRFWTFQVMETALFVVLAALLAGGCAWWIRRRIR